jgi:protein tyrosine phosphatase (PTP) superfamily phosphohydrolase (DUF442 family)
MNRNRGDNLAHTLVSTPVPAPRSALDSSKASARETSDVNGESILDHLPPLDLPADVTEKNATPPVAPAAERKTQPSTSASDHLSDRSAREPDVSLTGTSLLAPETALATGGVPGISRFAAVDLKLAGGSAPSTAGLNWLADKGYKTLVDLRESSETNLSFIAEAAQRGLRYIALPVSLKTIDRDHMARFNFELSVSDARPLYFFDSDGNKAGALWYIRRITVDRLNAQVARREAEELGLSDQAYWLAASNCLRPQGSTPGQISEVPETGKSATVEKAAEPPQAAVRKPSPAGQSSSPAPTPPVGTPPTESQAAIPKAATSSVPATKAPTAVDQASTEQAKQTAAVPTASTSSVPRDPSNLRPLLAMMITSLTFPLAYWSRAVVPTILVKTLASLPAPARRLKSLPRESGA